MARDETGSDGRGRTDGRGPRSGTAAWAAAQAVEQFTIMVNRKLELVSEVAPNEDGWKVGLEVVETPRIPDSTDLLATYEVELDADGELIQYRRTRRYLRGRADG